MNNSDQKGGKNGDKKLASQKRRESHIRRKSLEDEHVEFHFQDMDSFDTTRMNAASVASELDFNNENASVTHESQIMSDDADSVDLGKMQNVTAIRLKQELKQQQNNQNMVNQNTNNNSASGHRSTMRTDKGSGPAALGSNRGKNALGSQMNNLEEKKAKMIDDLTMTDVSFQQRVLHRLMAAKAVQKTFAFAEKTLTVQGSHETEP